AAPPILQRAVERFAGGGAGIDEVLRWGWLATIAAVVVWVYEGCVAIASRGVRLARGCRALSVLAVEFDVLSQAVALGRGFGTADQLIAEANVVTEATGTQVLQYAAP